MPGEMNEQGIRGKAKRYQATRLGLLPVRILLGLLFPLIAILGPSQALAGFLEARIGPWPLVVAIYFVGVSFTYTLWLLPLNFYQGFVVEKRFGLSIESAASWFADWLKGLAVSTVIGLPVVAAVYALIRYLPGWWWIVAGAVIALVAVVLSGLAPIIIYPLFFKFEPLENDVVRERLTSLAERSGTPLSGVYRMGLSAKSTEAEAMLAGIGHTRRIVLSDTLLDNYDLDETEVVLAHELGHHARRHLPVLIGGQSLSILAGLYVVSLVLDASVGRLGLTSVYDVANLPLLLLALSLMSTLATPAGNWLSRRLEKQADEFALSLTSKPAAFARAMTKLADQNLADLSPNPVVEFLVYAHPAVGRRIETARAFADERGLKMERLPAEERASSAVSCGSKGDG